MAPRPFRLRMPEPLEKDIHEACADALEALLVRPAEWCCYPAGHIKLTPADISKLVKAGLKRGYPDFMVFFDGVYGLEVKRRGEGLSKSHIAKSARGSPVYRIGQEEMFPRLIASGWKAIEVIHSVDEMVAQLKTWGIPMRV